MNATTSIWLLIALALVAANLPFVNERWLAIGPGAGRKTWWQRLFELVVLYLVVGGVGLALLAAALLGSVLFMLRLVRVMPRARRPLVALACPDNCLRNCCVFSAWARNSLTPSLPAKTSSH